MDNYKEFTFNDLIKLVGDLYDLSDCDSLKDGLKKTIPRYFFDTVNSSDNGIFVVHIESVLVYIIRYASSTLVLSNKVDTPFISGDLFCMTYVGDRCALLESILSSKSSFTIQTRIFLIRYYLRVQGVSSSVINEFIDTLNGMSTTQAYSLLFFIEMSNLAPVIAELLAGTERQEFLDLLNSYHLGTTLDNVIMYINRILDR